MSRKPAITSLEDLENIFVADKNPYWRLFAGLSVGGKFPNKLGENQEVDNIADSFALLLNRLQTYGNGTFTLTTQSNVKATNNQSMMHIIRLDTQAVGKVTGTSGMGMFNNIGDIMNFWKFMNDQTTLNDDATIDGISEQIEQKFEIERLRRELEDAKSKTRQDKIIGAVVDKLPMIIGALLPKQAVGILGTDIVDEEPEEQEQNQEEDEGNEETPSDEFSIDYAVSCLLQMQQALNIPANVLIEKISKFALKDPEQAKLLFSQI